MREYAIFMWMRCPTPQLASRPRQVNDRAMSCHPSASRPSPVALLLTVALGVLPGCALAPSAEVQSGLPRDRQASGAVADITVELSNPNDEPLPMREVQYSVEVVGQPGLSFSGKRAAEATIPANGVHKLTLPAAFPTGVDLAGAEYTISGSVSYLPPGQIAAVLYDYRVSRPSVGFRGRGKFAAAETVSSAPNVPKGK